MAIKKRLKFIAVFVAFSIFYQLGFPVAAYALTGGPSQPEVQSFQPIGVSDMVDVFSGDFRYNIPLLDVGGYPINLSYNSGVTMDQEASWVGLGWNINAGVVNRSVRGVPDDFSGDELVKEMNTKPNRTYGVTGAVGAELLGSDILSLGLNYELGLSYNNYSGYGFEQVLGLSLSAGSKAKLPLNGNLGFRSSSNDGLTISANVSFSARTSKTSKFDGSLSTSLGSSFNSRAGMQALTIGFNPSVGNLNLLGGAGSTSISFATPTYTPSITMPMTTSSVNLSFKPGLTFSTLDATINLKGYYSEQRLTYNTEKVPAYGYINSEKGQNLDKVAMDFNREKDGSIMPESPNIALTNFTYDIFSVSGQGIGGMYRPFRNDLGYVFDGKVRSTSDSYSLGVDLSGGGILKGGAEISVNDINSESGKWVSKNQAASKLRFRSKSEGGTPDFENYYFKEAGEKSVEGDASLYNIIGGDEAVRFSVIDGGGLDYTISNTLLKNHGAATSIPSDNYRKARVKRNQSIVTYTKAEVAALGLPVHPNQYNAPAHHIAQIAALRPDGQRYIYGIAAYNTTQEETSFSLGKSKENLSPPLGSAVNGLVKYPTGANSMSNKFGMDNYYSKTTTPAYAHSYLLTSILSPDYVDVDNIQGPSRGDIGDYTKFNYVRTNANYKWRTPNQKDSANFNEALRSDVFDNQANYVYGEKELWYTETIETKNYIAVFTLVDREDGLGVLDRNGGNDATATMKALSKISLYSKVDYDLNGASAIPIKEVHFEYSYDLCPNISNHATRKGKLTLKKVYFTYGKSYKSRLSPYEFTYSAFNPGYDMKSYDRWGYYKPNNPAGASSTSSITSNAEFPYIEQNRVLVDNYITAWALTEIKLPSKGKIKIALESDDYAYVQNKQAMQMMRITGFGDASGLNPAGLSKVLMAPSTLNYVKDYIYFELQEPISSSDPDALTTFRRKYLDGIDNLYFRVLADITASNDYDYVSGYAQIENSGFAQDIGGNYTHAWVKVFRADLKDNGGGNEVNPISKAIWNFGRLHNPRKMYDQSDPTGNAIPEVLKAMANSSFIKNFSTILLGGPNGEFQYKDFGKSITKGWLRLNSPNKSKLGGGVRVKRIEISDEWSSMVSDPDYITTSQGQEYTYTTTDPITGETISSGVAAYEPALGGDENPFKQPIFYSKEALLAPDNDMYVEEPFGESFFPSPSVGYSRVTVKNLQYDDVTRHATGSVVHEFYTARDFPTITKRTIADYKMKKTDPILRLFLTSIEENATISQGFVIELNDMHGKPKSQYIYPENSDIPISSMEYRYKANPYGKDSWVLANTVSVLNSDGSMSEKEIGVEYDFIADMREQKTSTLASNIKPNIVTALIGIFPIGPIPTVFPHTSRERVKVWSAGVTKVINRTSVLEETIVRDLGSKISTKNLAYDAETGEVLLTETQNIFNDPIYNFTYPAHWYYDGMSGAYKNVGVEISNATFSSGLASISNASTYFIEGDQLLFNSSVVWVTAVTASSIEVRTKSGANSINGTGDIKILNSGRTNQQSTAIGSLTTLSNPLSFIGNNSFENVVQASALEFTNKWKTFCNCFDKGGSDDIIESENPFIVGLKSSWRPLKSYAYLTGRDQSNFNNNTNIRKDGTFSSFNPFWNLSNKKWEMSTANWTWASEATIFNPYGNELENRDALNRFSAATFGYNNSMATSVSANSKYNEIGFDGFEDYDFMNCAQDHFSFKIHADKVSETEAHSGRRSIKINAGDSIILKKLVHDTCGSSF